MDTIARNIDYQFSHDFGNGFGFDQNAHYTHIDMTYNTVYGGTADPADSRSAFGVYGESDQYAIDNQLHYDTDVMGAGSRTLVGRYDAVNAESGSDDEVNDYDFTKRIGLTYKIQDDLSLYANYAESFQPPASRSLISGRAKPQEGEQYSGHEISSGQYQCTVHCGAV